jgi:hypothetical protein
MIGTSVSSINPFQPAAVASLCEASSNLSHAAKSLQVNQLRRMLVCSKEAAEILAPFVFGESCA